MNLVVSDIGAAIAGWRLSTPSDAAFAASAGVCIDARAPVRLDRAEIVHGCEPVADAAPDDAPRAAPRILSTLPASRRTQ